MACIPLSRRVTLVALVVAALAGAPSLGQARADLREGDDVTSTTDAIPLRSVWGDQETSFGAARSGQPLLLYFWAPVGELADARTSCDTLARLLALGARGTRVAIVLPLGAEQATRLREMDAGGFFSGVPEWPRGRTAFYYEPTHPRHALYDAFLPGRVWDGTPAIEVPWAFGLSASGRVAAATRAWGADLGRWLERLPGQLAPSGPPAPVADPRRVSVINNTGVPVVLHLAWHDGLEWHNVGHETYWPLPDGRQAWLRAEGGYVLASRIRWYAEGPGSAASYYHWTLRDEDAACGLSPQGALRISIEPTMLDAHAVDPASANTFASGEVRDAVSGEPVPAVTVVAQDPQGTIVGSARTDGHSVYQLPLTAGTGRSLAFSHPGYLPAVIYEVDGSSDRDRALPPVALIPETCAGEGGAMGKVLDAITGQPVPRASLTLRRGIGRTAGEVAASTVTDASGNYSVSRLPAGNYTASVGAAGYAAGTGTLVVVGGRGATARELFVCPAPEGHSVRILLTWDAQAGYLAPELEATLPGLGALRVTPDSPAAEPYVRLEPGAPSAPGARVFTVSDAGTGLYRVSVRDLALGGRRPGDALSHSAATVRLYWGDGRTEVFHVPVAQAGVRWDVLEILDGKTCPLGSIG